MMVIKKDGRLQNLDPEKIKTSVLNAASDTKAVLNESDIKIVVSDVIKTIETIRGKNENTSTYEIIGVLVNILKRDGFSNIVDAYLVPAGRD